MADMPPEIVSESWPGRLDSRRLTGGGGALEAAAAVVVAAPSKCGRHLLGSLIAAGGSAPLAGGARVWRGGGEGGCACDADVAGSELSVKTGGLSGDSTGAVAGAYKVITSGDELICDDTIPATSGDVGSSIGGGT